MKILLLFMSILINCYAVQEQKTFELNAGKCLVENDCYLYVKGLRGNFSIDLNGHIFYQNNKFHHNYDIVKIFVPSKMLQTQNIFIINSFDYAKNIEVTLSNSRASFVNIFFHQLFKYHITRYSTYFLIIGFLAILLIWLITKNNDYLPFSVYSFIGLLYLTSFSEIPRVFFNKYWLENSVHFSLLLMQELALFYLVGLVFKQKIAKKYIIVTFSASIFLLVLMNSFGASRNSFLSVMIFLVPLVCSSILFACFVMFMERKKIKFYNIMSCIFFLFLLFKINDVLVFWGVYEGYFTIKFYIPLILTVLFVYYVENHIFLYKKYSYEASYYRLYRQVAHDIRSPLEVLRAVTKDISMGEDKDLVDKAMRRIESVANDLLKEGRSQKKRVVSDLKSLIEESIELKSKEKEIDFDIKIDGNHFLCELVESDFLSILSNLFNNSIEAHAKKIKISIFELDSIIKLTIKDNGEGASAKDLKTIGSIGSTSKKDGHGIGLSSAKQMIQSFGGSLSFYSVEHQGFSVDIELPLFTHKVVLIDNDDIIHRLWSKEAQKANRDLLCFYNVDEFLKNVPSNKTIPIYIDSDLGDGVIGEVEAKKIAHLGFKKIYLATAFFDKEKTLPDYIVDVVGKRPQF